MCGVHYFWMIDGLQSKSTTSFSNNRQIELYSSKNQTFLLSICISQNRKEISKFYLPLHCSPEVTGCGAFFSLCTFMEMSIEARVSSFTN